MSKRDHTVRVTFTLIDQTGTEWTHSVLVDPRAADIDNAHFKALQDARYGPASPVGVAKPPEGT